MIFNNIVYKLTNTGTKSQYLFVILDYKTIKFVMFRFKIY